MAKLVRVLLKDAYYFIWDSTVEISRKIISPETEELHP